MAEEKEPRGDAALDRQVVVDSDNTQRLRTVVNESIAPLRQRQRSTAEVVASSVIDALALAACVTLAIAMRDKNLAYIALVLVGLIAGVRVADFMGRGNGSSSGGVGGIGAFFVAIASALAAWKARGDA